jgi:hypothetical protein
LLGVFLLGVPLAGAIETPLPRVQIVLNPEEQTGTEPGEEAAEAPEAESLVEGRLVAHTDSCWHLFVAAEEAEETEEAIAAEEASLPDDRVSEARVYEVDTEGDTPGGTS